MNDGKITDEGKFRGQPWQAVAFHLLAIQGCADHQIIDEHEPKAVYIFELTHHDHATYGIPLQHRRARLMVTPEQVTIEFE